MTTITPSPDSATEEETKVLSYKPGDTVNLTFVVSESDGSAITGEITACEVVSGENEEEETESETPETMGPSGRPMPKAVMMVAGKKGAY